MWHDAAQRRFDVLLFWALDRFSREGVLETLKYLERLNSFGINWRSHTEQYLDSCGAFRDAVLAILAGIAEQERIRISGRTRAGVDRAREKGMHTGRPIAGPALCSATIRSGSCGRKGCPGVRSLSDCTPAPRRYEGRTSQVRAILRLAGKRARKPVMFETGSTPVRPPLRPPDQAAPARERAPRRFPERPQPATAVKAPAYARRKRHAKQAQREKQVSEAFAGSKEITTRAFHDIRSQFGERPDPRRMHEARERVPGRSRAQPQGRAASEAAGDRRVSRLEGGNAWSRSISEAQPRMGHAQPLPQDRRTEGIDGRDQKPIPAGEYPASGAPKPGVAGIGRHNAE